MYFKLFFKGIILWNFEPGGVNCEIVAPQTADGLDEHASFPPPPPSQGQLHELSGREMHHSSGRIFHI